MLLSLWRGDSFDVAVLSLRDRRMHTRVESNAYSPLWLSTGHVLFQQGNALLALAFDAIDGAFVAPLRDEDVFPS